MSSAVSLPHSSLCLFSSLFSYFLSSFYSFCIFSPPLLPFLFLLYFHLQPRFSSFTLYSLPYLYILLLPIFFPSLFIFFAYSLLKLEFNIFSTLPPAPLSFLSHFLFLFFLLFHLFFFLHLISFLFFTHFFILSLS